MTYLLDSYKSKTIQHICPECEREVNEKLSAMKLICHGWYSRMIKVWMRNKRIRAIAKRNEV
jgi:hypothetical protein